MDNISFKKLFNFIAKGNKFESSSGGWFKESNECIAALYLQKSRFGNYYDLNIKVFIQGSFGFIYNKNKELKYATSEILGRQPEEYKNAMDLECSMSDEMRKQMLEKLFIEFVVPFVDKMLSRKKIMQLNENKELFLLESVKRELEKLEKNVTTRAEGGT